MPGLIGPVTLCLPWGKKRDPQPHGRITLDSQRPGLLLEAGSRNTKKEREREMKMLNQGTM